MELNNDEKYLVDLYRGLNGSKVRDYLMEFAEFCQTQHEEDQGRRKLFLAYSKED